MLSRDQGLASIAGQLVGRGQPLTRFSSPADVPDWLRPPTRMVVLDYPKTARAVVYRQLRQRYQGPVLALLDPDEDSSGLPTDHGRIGTLHRPFTGEELSASLDELAGSRNGARGSKSDSLTAPPLGADADTAAPLDVSAVFAATPARLRARHEASGAAAVPPAISWVRLATPTAGQGGAAAGAGATQAVVGVPAARVAVRRVGAARRRRGLWSRHMGPAARQRVNGLLLILAATAALIVGVTLSDGGGCRSTGCRNIAGAAESGGAGIPPSSTIPATPQPGDPPGAGSGKGGAVAAPLGPHRRNRGQHGRRHAHADDAADRHDLAPDHAAAGHHRHDRDHQPAGDDRAAHHHHRSTDDNGTGDDRAGHDGGHHRHDHIHQLTCGELSRPGREPPAAARRERTCLPCYSSMLDITCLMRV